MLKSLMLLATAVFLVHPAAVSAAEDVDHSALHVAHGWARASLGQNPNSAAYVTIHNPGKSGDRLLGVLCAASKSCSLHKHVTVANVTRMEQVESLDLPSGAHIEFKPGGYHIMMFDLKGPLAAGTETAITFTFEEAGDLTITMPVLSMADAAKLNHEDHRGMQH